MGTFNVLSTYVTCEYVTELPFTIEDNSSSLLSPHCSFIADVAPDEIFGDAKRFVCTIKNNKLRIYSAKLEKSKAKEQMISLADELIDTMNKIFLKMTRKDKNLFVSFIANGKIRLGDIDYYSKKS